MNDITLATLIEEKYRADFLNDNDAAKYQKNNWLIDELIQLFKKYPKIKRYIKVSEMSINRIMAIIEWFFEELRKERDLDNKRIFFFIEKHQEYRKLESIILLLILGGTFINVFNRMKNNQKDVGEILSVESRFYGATSLVDYKIKMPCQKVDSQVKNLYGLICNESVPSEVIENEIAALEEKVNDKQSYITEKSKKGTRNKK